MEKTRETVLDFVGIYQGHSRDPCLHSLSVVNDHHSNASKNTNMTILLVEIQSEWAHERQLRLPKNISAKFGFGRSLLAC